MRLFSYAVHGPNARLFGWVLVVLFYLMSILNIIKFELHSKIKRKLLLHSLMGPLSSSACLFGLCNAPATLQICMLSIFLDMLKDTIKVIMDDFSIVGDSLECCLEHLGKVLECCAEMNLVLN